MMSQYKFKLAPKRYNIGRQENWKLNSYERTLVNKMAVYLRECDYSNLSRLYEQVYQIPYKLLSSHKRDRVKYLLMFMWKLRLVRITYVAGMVKIRWNKKKKEKEKIQYIKS